ncbi:MAG: tRNA (N6-threonylcarbamoyladenosine(37)-N6)-methyltransferase TrmO [Clostridiales bacterium]|jgi:tRNA-Thr(GGU) m(6)t(6)A37 methyltransferase TsaA|nr:tRNA (N6-threonylcarbamoyladenosine(37)-N6)-methyltransferase TrmO [Clostridiales bacterium]
MQNFIVKPIGVVKNNDKGAFIEINSEYAPALQALEGFSHINVIWWFDDFDNKEARGILEVPQPYKKSPLVMGVFATRSPIRPNPIALTASQVLNIDYKTGVIEVAYIDANDGSPVLDIKPYTPSVDRIEMPGVPDFCSHWPKSLETSEGFDWENEFNF